jgi:protein ImuB
VSGHSEVEVVRTLVVWCPDWPVVAAGVPLDVPAAVLQANRVVACSPVARAEGVARHQRRRDAQARCPQMVVLDHDPTGEARAFEPVVQALEALTPRTEITYPGACAFPTRGPSRYHGGDEALAALAGGLVADVLAGRGPVRVGVADGPFAAGLAAARAARSTSGPAGPVVVPPGGGAAFLAPLPIEVLDDPGAAGGSVGGGAVPVHDMVGVFVRLGLRTLGDLAALPVAEIVGRFGAAGWTAHRLASGLDRRPPVTEPPPPDLTVAAELDPPVERVEAAAFVARGLTDDLHRRLTARGSACTRLIVGVETEHGERHERVWRTEGTFTALAIADRVRWQLDGWLAAGAHRPSGPLTGLWLAPEEVVPAGGRQLAFSSGRPGAVDAVEAGDRVARALARVQGLVGVEAVRMPEWRGGRGPAERVELVPVAAADVTEPRPAALPGWVAEPWPGVVPDPAPAAVHDPPLPAEVVDASGRPVSVSGRGEVSAEPATLAVGVSEGANRAGRASRDAAPVAVAAWAGPWPCVERWWDPRRQHRRARLQVTTAAGSAYLLVVEGGRWWVEATYD